MKSLFPIAYTIASVHTMMFGINPDLSLPTFEELQKSVSHQSSLEEKEHPNNIVVTFNDEKKVPQISHSDQVSVDFINEDIKSVLRYISELYDLNIIIPTSLSGNVTLRLKNVTWQALLTSVLTPLGCSYQDNDGIIQIGSNEMIKQEPLQTKTFLLKYADAKTVAEELKDFIDKENKEKLTFNARTNILIWTGHNKNQNNIEAIIDKLDKPETQVMIEAKFVEANNTSSDNRGIEWPSSLAAYLDESGDNETTETGSSSSSDDTHGQVKYKLSKAKAFNKNNLFVKTLTSTFNFSKTDNIGKTLSNPTIITMNNVPATMSVIQNYPIPNYSYNSDKGQYEISGFEEKPIGIELKVTPKVQSEYITLQLDPSLSDQSDSVNFSTGTGTSVNYPIINQKKTSSTVTIKSGYTIAIGGLISQTKSDNITKTPLFGDIPLLGNLFTNKNKSDTIKNLLIFLSATQIAYDGSIIYPNQMGAKNISDKRMFEMGISQKDLPGELPSTDDEKKMYEEIQVLQNKLDNLLMIKKANESKTAINKNLIKENKPSRVYQPGKNRTAQLKKNKDKKAHS